MSDLFQRRDDTMADLYWQQDTLEDPVFPNFVAARTARENAQGYYFLWPHYPQHLRDDYERRNMSVDVNKSFSPGMSTLAAKKIQEKMYNQIFPQKK